MVFVCSWDYRSGDGEGKTYIEGYQDLDIQDIVMVKLWQLGSKVQERWLIIEWCILLAMFNCGR